RPDVHPTIFFADSKKLAAFTNGLSFRISTDEGIVVIAPHLVNSARAGIGQEIMFCVLQPIGLLDEQHVCVGALQAGNVILAPIAGHVQPFHVPLTISTYYASPYGYIGSSSQWIEILPLHRIRS